MLGIDYGDGWGDTIPASPPKGDDSYLLVDSGDYSAHGFVNFDLSELPSDAMIESAELRMFLEERSSPPNEEYLPQIHIYEWPHAWQEQSYNRAMLNGVFHADSSAGESIFDFYDRPIAAAAVERGKWLSFDLSEQMQRRMVQGMPQGGWMIKGFSVPYWPLWISSRETERAPALHIRYRLGTTPSQLFLPLAMPGRFETQHRGENMIWVPLGTSAWNGPAEDDPLALILESDKLEYDMGEVPKVRARLVNQGDESATVVYPLDGSITGLRTPYYFWDTRHADGRLARRKSVGGCINFNPFVPEDFAELSPNESLEVNSEDWLGQPTDFHSITEPGEYQIRLHYAVDGRGMLDDPILAPLWARTTPASIQSETITIRVRPPVEAFAE